MRFNARLVKITEYSLYWPKSSLGTLVYDKVLAPSLPLEEANARSVTALLGLGALRKKLLADDRSIMVNFASSEKRCLTVSEGPF